MKQLLYSVISAFSAFSVLPMPQIEWRQEYMRGLLSSLPLVGAVIGAFGCLYFALSSLLQLPAILSAVVLTLLPVVLSGGIHMDGFADTIDALSSHAAPEKKRAILKDPHTGAFAIIGVVSYLLLYFGLCAALPLHWRQILLLGLTHVLSRAVGALASVTLPGSSREGMLHMFSDGAARSSSVILLLWAAVTLAAMALLSPAASALSAPGAVCVFCYLKRMSAREFGGMSGDLAGYCITITAIVLLLGLVLAERITTLWF
jgi:adenosylcobinamide-GDP ribazoletransferase